MTPNLSPVLEFISNLAANNNRPYFQDHKAEYDRCKRIFEDAVGQMIVGISQFDDCALRQSAKECIFRIFRDVRFSPDKAPYKRHFGAYIAPGGRKSMLGGYYLHIQQGESMLCGGLWCLPPALVKMIHEELTYNAQPLLDAVSDPMFIKRIGKLTAFDQYKRIPSDFKQYESEPYGEWLKFKNFNAVCHYSDAEVCSDDFIERVVEDCKLLQPINDYFNAIIKDEV